MRRIPMSTPGSLRLITKSPDSVAGQGKQPVLGRLWPKHASILAQKSRKSPDGTAGQGIWAGGRRPTPGEELKSQDCTAGQGKFRRESPAPTGGQGKNHQTARLVRAIVGRKPTSIEQGVPVGTKELDRDAEQREVCAGSELVKAMRGT